MTSEQVAHATRVLGKLGDDYSLTRVLTELKYLDPDRLRDVLSENRHQLRIGDVLVELGHIKARDLRAAFQARSEDPHRGQRLGEILLAMGFIQEQRLHEVLTEQLGFVAEEPNFEQIDPKLLAEVGPGWCERFQAMPLRRKKDGVLVAFRDPLESEERRAAEAAFGRVIPAIATRHVLDAAIRAFERHGKDVDEDRGEALESAAVQQVNALIGDALKKGVTHLHIEPMRHVLRVRWRFQGALTLHRELDREIAQALANRLKQLARLDHAHDRHHQNGGFQFQDPASGRVCDVRATFMATVSGCRIVLRLLSAEARLRDITQLGMGAHSLERLRSVVLEPPGGMAVIAGPGAAGKTTSLYACIDQLNSMERSILTLEEPVEQVLEGVTQTSFGSDETLRPGDMLAALASEAVDVIAIGVIGQRVSPDLAINAALAGPKLLCTMAADDSLGALSRLSRMHGEISLISSTITAILTQRLVRRVCEHCAEVYEPGASDLQRVGWSHTDIAGARFRVGAGCANCQFTGYAGQIGVFELLVPNERITRALARKRPLPEIRRIGIETAGLVTLMEDGLAKAALGLTTIQEVLRHLPRGEQPRPYREILQLTGPPVG